MILFPCEACGKVICADDQSANQHLPCPYCQKMLTVPAESVVDCCLVYRDPRQPNGEPMSSTELQEQLEAGNLHASDLIWTKQVWRPLNQVLNLPLAVSAPQNDQPEIAVRFEELAPLPGFAPLEKKTARRKKRGAKASATMVVASDAGPKTPLTERLKKIVFVLIALGVLGFGVVRALRIYNYATNRVASVMVFNGTDNGIAFQLPFSGFDPLPVPANSYSTCKKLVVGIPCRKAMNIWLATGNIFTLDFRQLGTPAKKISVPIWPCHDTMVNYGQIPFPVYRNIDELYTTDALAPQKQCKAAVQEIASNRPPTLAKKLYDQAQGKVREHLVKMVNDAIFIDKDYNFAEMKVTAGDREEFVASAVSSDNRNLLLKPERFSHEFPGGVFTIQGEAELVNLTMKVSANFRPPVPDLEFEASGSLNITKIGTSSLLLEMALIQHHSETIPEQYRGNWQYVAQQTPQREWFWHWTFSNGEKTIRIDADGAVSNVK